MNFFRSEEHLCKWEGFKEDGKDGIITLSDAMRLFCSPFFTRRGEPDYFSHMASYSADMLTIMDSLENAGSYWRLKWFEKLVFGLVLRLKSG
jgi:hypothetical protein